MYSIYSSVQWQKLFLLAFLDCFPSLCFIFLALNFLNFFSHHIFRFLELHPRLLMLLQSHVLYSLCCFNLILCSLSCYSTGATTSFIPFVVVYILILYSFCWYCTVHLIFYSLCGTLQPHPLFLMLLQSHPLFLMLLQPLPLFLMFLKTYPLFLISLQPYLLFLMLLQPYPIFIMFLQPHPLFLMLRQHRGKGCCNIYKE